MDEYPIQLLGCSHKKHADRLSIVSILPWQVRFLFVLVCFDVDQNTMFCRFLGFAVFGWQFIKQKKKTTFESGESVRFVYLNRSDHRGHVLKKKM